MIGAGLFDGSSVVIQAAGPGAVISFLITGLLVLLVMRIGVRAWRGRGALPRPIEPVIAETHHFGEL